MSDGIYIKTPPLTREDAALAFKMLGAVQVRASEAEHALRILGSLARIANGVDQVVPVPAEKPKSAE